MFCPKLFKPVCGSDGKVYSNTCVMHQAACTEERHITEVNNEQCERKKRILLGKHTRRYRVNTKCPGECPYTWEPVCGTDGQTYGNLCQLDFHNCHTDSSISVAKVGECKSKNMIYVMSSLTFFIDYGD